MTSIPPPANLSCPFLPGGSSPLLRTLFGLILALLLLPGCSPERPGAANRPAIPVPVQTEPVHWSAEALPVAASGVVTREDEAPLSFKIGGVIDFIGVRPGDSVRQGSILAALHLAEIDSQVRQAQSSAEKARRDLQRAQILCEKHVIAVEQKQDAETALQLAEAALKSAVFNREFAVIRAPADGKILVRSAEPGEVIAAGRPILGFAGDASPWLLTVGISEEAASRINIGDQATVTFRDAQRTKVAAVVRRIAEATDAATRTVKVEIALSLVPSGIRSGYLASARIQPRPVHPRPRVPLSALVEGREKTAFVYLVQSGKAERHQVEVETLTADWAFLATQLPESRDLVVSGAERVWDGAPVEVVRGNAVAVHENTEREKP